MRPSHAIGFGIFFVFLLSIFGLLIWDLASKAEDYDSSYNNSAQIHEGETVDRIISSCGAELGELVQRRCIVQEIQAYQERAEAKKQSNAVSDTAWYTAAIAWTGAIGIVVGTISIYLLWRTLVSSQSIGNESRSIGQAQVRAYLDVVASDFKWVDQPIADRRIKLLCAFQNYGQSPAFDIGVMSSLLLVGIEDKNPNELFVARFEAAEPNSGVLASSNQAFFEAESDFTLTEQTYTSVFGFEPSKTILLYGSLAYRDIFGITRSTRFCKRLEVERRVKGKAGRARWATFPVGNSAT